MTAKETRTDQVIEKFVVEEYRRLLAENKLMREKLEDARVRAEVDRILSSAEPALEITRCHDLKEPFKAVRFEVCGLYMLESRECGISDDGLREAAELDDDALLEWAQRTYEGSNSYALTLIKIQRKTFYYRLRFDDQIGTRTLVTTGREMDTLYPIREFDTDNPEMNMWRWMPAYLENEITKEALGIVRSYISKALEKRNKEEARA